MAKSDDVNLDPVVALQRWHELLAARDELLISRLGRERALAALADREVEIARLNALVAHLDSQLKNYEASTALRVGRVVTGPFRWLVAKLGRAS